MSTDFELMRAVAATLDARSEEIRAMLQGFVGRMRTVPPGVWGGIAATRFKDVMDRWDAESAKLVHALHGIAETIRYNERTLRDAAHQHSRRIAAAGDHLS
ncbi:WXG100 family type VII secretion target [Mycobacterium sp. pUA109]|uniref:WXG100 family type VII secretion target n=1 Tax=Mycobacterium sp. pUA109 TaxID=3238982 RepID=UPI00351BD6D9